MEAKVEHLELKKRSKWGGARPNSGPKQLLSTIELKRVRELVSQHASEKDETDLEKRERILVLMEVLYEEGKVKRNIGAIKEYLDRQTGKAKESVDVTSGGNPIIQIAQQVAEKHYVPTPDTGISRSV